MAVPLLYSNNANIKYPLSDFHEVDISNDIIVDLTLTLGPEFTPVVATVRISPFIAYVSIENETTGEQIATAAILDADVFSVYPLEMCVPGNGWIVFGQGITEEFYTGAVEIAIDPECITQLEQDAPRFAVQTNGFTYDVENLLVWLTANDFITITAEGNRIYLDRNDAILTPTQLNSFTQVDGSIDTDLIFFTIAGAVPDANGNISINVINPIEQCDDVWALSVPRGDTGLGESDELPLDKFFSRQFSGGNSCVESSSSSSEPEDIFDGAQLVSKITILDRKNDNDAGTLYTVTDQGAVPSVPNSVEATALDQITVLLDWDPPISEGSSPIAGYKIERFNSGEGLIVIQLDTGNTVTTYVDATASPGTTYTYFVSAINSFGVGPAGVSNEVTTPTDGSFTLGEVTVGDPI